MRLRTLWVGVLVGVALLGVAARTAWAAGGWSAPVVLSPSGENSIDVRVAMNTHGDAVVVWRHRIDPYHSSIEVSSRAGYGPFTAPAVISDWQVMDPRVVVDRDGNATVVWAESGQAGDATGDVIRASAGHAGGSFDPPVTLWKDSGTSGTHNVCAGIDSAGRATAFWTAADGPAVLRYATRAPGGSFGAVGSLPNAGEQVGWPACAVSANGDTFASWTDGLRVQVAVRPARSGAFTTKVVRPFDENKPLTSIAGLAADGRGNAIVTWGEATDQSYSAMWGKASRRAPGGSFGAPETITRSGGGTQPFIGDDGRTEALGFSGSQLDPPVGEGIGSLTRSSDGTWGAYEQWSPTGWDQNPAAAFDSAGNLFAAYRLYYDRESPHGRALATIRPAGGHFSAQETPISADGHNIWDVALAAGGAGHAVAVWPRGEMDDFHIELAEYGATPSVGGTAAAGGGGFGPGSEAGGSSASGEGSAPPPPMRMSHRVRAVRHHRRARCRRHAPRRHRKRACRHR
jgi:hypothetical protein